MCSVTENAILEGKYFQGHYLITAYMCVCNSCLICLIYQNIGLSKGATCSMVTRLLLFYVNACYFIARNGERVFAVKDIRSNRPDIRARQDQTSQVKIMLYKQILRYTCRQKKDIPINIFQHFNLLFI